MKRAGFRIIFLSVLSILTGPSPIAAQDLSTRMLEGLSVDQKLGQLVILEAVANGDVKHEESYLDQIRSVRPGVIHITSGSPVNVNRFLEKVRRLDSSLPTAFMGGAQQSYFPLPGVEVMSSVNDQSLLKSAGELVAKSLVANGIMFMSEPFFNKQSQDYSIYGQYLADAAILTPVLPVLKTNLLTETGGHQVIMVPAVIPEPGKRRQDVSLTTINKFRKQGFKGFIIADLSNVSVEDIPLAAEVALEAGADMLYGSRDNELLISEMTSMVKEGQLDDKMINQKVSRIIITKMGFKSPPETQPQNQKGELLISRLYKSSVSLNRNTNNFLPLGLLDTLNAAFIHTRGSHEYFFKMLNKYIHIENEKGTRERLMVLNRYNLLFARLTSESTPEEWALLQTLNQSVKLIVVADGDLPLVRLKDFKWVIRVPEPNDTSIGYVPQAIFGAVSFKGRYSGATLPQGFDRGIATRPIGRLSYSTPLEVGMNAKVLDQIAEVANEAIRNGATPGMQVLVARKGVVVFEKSYGYYTYDQAQPVTNETIYDLASVTKVTSTLQAVTFMADRGLIDVNKKISEYLPEMKGSNKENLIIKDILLHQAGLKPWMPFWQQTMTEERLSPELYSEDPGDSFPLQVSMGLYTSPVLKDSVWKWIIDSKLIKLSKGQKKHEYKYSDMGFYIMQQLAERILNQPLDEFMQQNFYDPMGMQTTGYLPLCKHSLYDIAPTAEDPYFRKQLIQGIVHDEGAAMFGGVAGHSGLFSNANDIAKLMQMNLWNGTYGGEVFFRPTTHVKFTKKQVQDNRRGLGWDKPIPGEQRSPTSIYASAATYGHTGFTGTAVWVDPASELVYVFLSNRIHPDPENNKLISLNIRSKIQDLIYASILDVSSTGTDSQ